MTEKRKETRFAYEAPIKWANSNRIIESNTRDISYSGVFVETLAPCAIGEKIKITFQLTANLGDGKYLISLGVTRFQENDELEVIHRRYDAEELQIINSDGSFGIANCDGSIRFENQ